MYIARVHCNCVARTRCSASFRVSRAFDGRLDARQFHQRVVRSLMASMNSFFGGARPKPSDKVTLCPTNPAFSESTCLDELKINGRQYTRKSALARGQRSRERRSPIWRFREDLVRVDDGLDVYYC